MGKIVKKILGSFTPNTSQAILPQRQSIPQDPETIACHHEFYVVHHYDDDGHHYCPTGFLMCACGLTVIVYDDDVILCPHGWYDPETNPQDGVKFNKW